MLKNSLILTRKHRRKDATFTFFVIKSECKERFLQALDKLGLEVLKDCSSETGLRECFKTIENTKLCILDINHLYGKKEDLEILLKVEKPTALCLQERWKTTTNLTRLEKYMVVETLDHGALMPDLNS